MRVLPIRILMTVALLGLLTACEHNVPPPPAPIDVSGSPYRINVASVSVVSDYTSSRNPPHMEQTADISPETAVRQWVAGRLIAGGQMGRLEVTIKDATILKKDVPKQKTGIEGFLTKEQTEEYDGSLAVEVKIYNMRKILPVAHIEAAVHQSQTLREDASAYDRKLLVHNMTASLMRELEGQLDNNIRQYFVRYLI